MFLSGATPACPPQRGGANGSIRFDPELKHGANAGLGIAVKLLEPIKKKARGYS
jgi:L-ascorbate peroxidase